jgi:hypothetical protein
VLLADLDRTQRRQVRRDELTIQQARASCAQCGDKPGQRHLGCVGPDREHAFAAEDPIEADAIQAADELRRIAVGRLPALDRMRVPQRMQRFVAGLDAVADPASVLTFTRGGAGVKYLGEGSVAGHGEAATT